MSYCYRQPPALPGAGSRQSIGRSSTTAFTHTPMATSIRPSSSTKFSGQVNRGNGGPGGRQPYGYGYNGGAASKGLNEKGWSFGAPSCPPSSYQQYKQGLPNPTPMKPAAYAIPNSNGSFSRSNSSGRVPTGAMYQQPQSRGGSSVTNLRPPAYITPQVRASGSTTASQQFQRSGTTNPRMSASPGVSVQANSGGVASTGQEIPPEGENVKYITLNWEDILGGKDGMNKLQVRMAPPTQDNPNRQLSIGFGGSDGPAPDGSVPLKVLKFEPLPIGSTSTASINVSGTNSPAPTPRSSSSNMTAGAGAGAGNRNYSQPQAQARPQMQMQMQGATTTPGASSPYGNFNDQQMQQLMSGISVKQTGDGQYPVITLPPGFKLAGNASNGAAMQMPMTMGGAGGQFQVQTQGQGQGQGQASSASAQQCNCPACQYRQ